jgi:hypothetical protein
LRNPSEKALRLDTESKENESEGKVMHAPISPPTPRAVALVTVALTIMLASLSVASARAAEPAAGWAIRSVARPTNFSSADGGVCSEGAEVGQCDSYALIVTDTGSRGTEGIVKITDTLPPGLQIAGEGHITGEQFSEMETTHEWSESEEGRSRVKCVEPTSSTVGCTYGEAGEKLPPGGVIVVVIPVEVTGLAFAGVTNRAIVEGGGAATELTSEPSTTPNTVNGKQSAFGIQDFSLAVDGVDGAPDLQAGDHPYAVTASFDLASIFNSRFERESGFNGAFPVRQAKDIIVDLPQGLVGDPQAAAQCPEKDLAHAEHEPFEISEHTFGRTTTPCPTASQVGSVMFIQSGEPSQEFTSTFRKFDATTPLYSLVPQAGYPAEFGFNFFSKVVTMFASVVPSPTGYHLRVAVPGIVRGLNVKGVSLTFFGDPNARSGGANAPSALFTNPALCNGGPLSVKIEADSWEEPGHWVSTREEPVVYPRVEGCNMLQFDPTLELKPETTQADKPSGYEVDLKVPQVPNVFPNVATPELKGATVTLPQGVSVSPGAADGLVGCQEVGPEGINITSNWTPTGAEALDAADPEAMEVGADGLSRIAPGHCPAKSQVGEVELTTPLLAHPLKGRIYLAQPTCGGAGQPACTEASATNGELYGLYLEVSGSGVIVKLKGTVEANPQTGRLTARFDENPQLPFEELRLMFTGGERAPLANPQTCGLATTTSVLEPWGGSIATPSSSPFDVTGCASPTPFAPGFTAGTVTSQAGAYSPFTLTFSRNDGEQDLAGVTVTTPPGVSGILSKLPLCGEPQAQAGTCPEASKIGRTNVAAGAGSAPLWLPGSVYLTGPYKGAPFGLSIVVPAKAGPFNLGNEVVRAAINVDPYTARITVTSDPLPQIKDGVPFRVKTVNVTIDRPEFIFNPTNCSQLNVTGTVSGEMPDGSAGSTVPVSSPFAVAGCKNMPFKPKLTVSTSGKTSRSNGASLTAKLTYPAGPLDANIAKIKVDLPEQLPSRLTTLQKACTAAVFQANPASCPTASIVGHAKAITPILPVPLEGPAYFVSHGGEAFPSLIVVLQGYGVTVDLVGTTFISKAGITSSTFKSVPDVPVGSFELTLPEGRYSALAANGNLCKSKLAMPTAFVGQSGAEIHESTPIAVTGCKPALGVVRHSVKGRTATIVVSVPSAGKLAATGAGLSPATGQSDKGGLVTVALTLSNKEQGLLGRHPGRRLKVAVKLLFIPKHGSRLSSHVTVLMG